MAIFGQIQPQEKAIYVALGNDREEGLKTLRWALQRWKSQPISITILHIDMTKDTVDTYFGKMPASSVNEEMLKVLRKNEQEKVDKLLSLYKAFCGKVKAEIFRVEKFDKPIREHIVDLISGLHITNLVMGLTFLRSSSRRSKSAIRGCSYVHQNKPEFCDFFIVSGGKEIVMKEDKFVDSNPHGSPSPSSSNPSSPSVEDQWESNAEAIENYFSHLLSLNFDEEEVSDHQENDVSHQSSSMEAAMKELQNSNMSVEEKSEHLRRTIEETNERIRSKRIQAKASAERLEKAKFAISLCNRRKEGVEALVAKEAANRAELRKELDATRELLHEAIAEVEESKKRLSSVADLGSKLSERLQRSAEARSEAEERLKEAVVGRMKTAGEMEELRRQRDVLRRRIEFCRERERDDAIAVEEKCELREFSGEEMIMATENFSEQWRLKSGGDWTTVYKGRINLQTVAIKVINALLPREDFLLKVQFLAQIRHPNLIAMMGFCSEPKCIVFEYMHNGSLRDILFSSCRNSAKRNQALPWHFRIRIAAQVCSSLCYLHLAKPKPIVHGHLTASNILLDRSLVAKISGFGLAQCHTESLVGSDVKAFGLLLMQLLTGSNWAGIVDEAMLKDKEAFAMVPDKTAGDWPLDVVEGLAMLAFRCLTFTTDGEPNTDLSVEMLMEELEELRKKADELVYRRGLEEIRNEGEHRQDSSEVPCVFLCPIFHEVMKNPHVAADGFSYEREAIEEWLKMGRDTSPMTNLKLNHKFLTPNHTLLSLIQDWHNKRSIVPSSSV